MGGVGGGSGGAGAVGGADQPLGAPASVAAVVPGDADTLLLHPRRAVDPPWRPGRQPLPAKRHVHCPPLHRHPHGRVPGDERGARAPSAAQPLLAHRPAVHPPDQGGQPAHRGVVVVATASSRSEWSPRTQWLSEWSPRTLWLSVWSSRILWLSEWSPRTLWLPFHCQSGALRSFGYKRRFTVQVAYCQSGVLGYKCPLLASFDINDDLRLKWTPRI